LKKVSEAIPIASHTGSAC